SRSRAQKARGRSRTRPAPPLRARCAPRRARPRPGRAPPLPRRPCCPRGSRRPRARALRPSRPWHLPSSAPPSVRRGRGTAAVGGLSRRGVLGGLLLLGGGRIARLLRSGFVLRGRRLGRGGGGRVLGGVVPLRRAHPVGGRGRRRLEAHPAVLGAEPHLGPGAGVAGGDGPFLPVLLTGGEPDD